MSRSETAALLKIVALAVALGAMAAIFYWAKLKGDEDALARSQARAVHDLPAGVEEAWTAYVSRQLARGIKREGDIIRLAPDEITRAATFVSPNTPYRVECFPDFVMGAWVNFGQGEQEHMVPVFGNTDFKIRGEKPPALGVDEESVAAAGLAEKLCRQIVGHMQTVMLPSR
jgi:hypothetical protein